MLYVVGTPIGNLGDMSPRGIKALTEADFICAEDTRVTAKLLTSFDIKKPMVSLNEHNIRAKTEGLIARLQNGEIGAVVTDAGMPCISDPGQFLVDSCIDMGIDVKAVPGPTAVTTALALSGLYSEKFAFFGFLPNTQSKKTTFLKQYENLDMTMIFYESPHRVESSIKAMAEVLGSHRRCAVIREITKIYEETVRGTLEELVLRYKDASLKGEFVIIVEGEKEKKRHSLDEALTLAKQRIKDGDSPSMAAKIAAKETGIKKGEIYKALLEQDED